MTLISYWDFVVSFYSYWEMSDIKFCCSFSHYSGYLTCPYETWTKFWKVSGRCPARQEKISWIKCFWEEKCQKEKKKRERNISKVEIWDAFQVKRWIVISSEKRRNSHFVIVCGWNRGYGLVWVEDEMIDRFRPHTFDRIGSALSCRQWGVTKVDGNLSLFLQW